MTTIACLWLQHLHLQSRCRVLHRLNDVRNRCRAPRTATRHTGVVPVEHQHAIPVSCQSNTNTPHRCRASRTPTRHNGVVPVEHQQVIPVSCPANINTPYRCRAQRTASRHTSTQYSMYFSLTNLDLSVCPECSNNYYS